MPCRACKRSAQAANCAGRIIERVTGLKSSEQALMRHANPQVMLGIYTHAVDSKKRSAQSKVVQLVAPPQQMAAGGVST